MRSPKTPDHWMAFNCGDYLKSTQDLEAIEHGAYLLIIMYLFCNNGCVEDDQETLRRISKVTPKAWPAVWKRIQRFFTVEDGQIHQARVDRERAKAAELSAKRRVAGSKGGRATAAAFAAPIAAPNATANGGDSLPRLLQQSCTQEQPQPQPLLNQNQKPPTTSIGSESARARVGGGSGVDFIDEDDPTEPLATRIARTFIRLRKAFWPNNPNFPANLSTLEGQAQKLVDDGLTLDLAFEHLERVMAKQAANDQSPPTSLNAYHLSLHDVAVKTQAAKPLTPRQKLDKEDRRIYGARIAAYAKDRNRWNEVAWGPKPDSWFAKFSDDVIAEYGLTREPQPKAS